MRDILLTVFILGAIPLIVARPYIGILFFAWFGYMNPHRFTWGFAYTMPFAALIGLATILGFFLTRDKNKIPLTALTVIWFAWVIWMNITTLVAIAPDTDWLYSEWERTMKIQLMSIIALSLLQSKKKIDMLVWVMAISVGFFGIKGGIFVILTGGNNLVWGPPGTFFEGNNGLALALLMVMPLFWYLRLTTNKKWIRYGLAACIVLMALSVLGSYSRGAFLGIAAVTLYLVWKSPYRWRMLPVLCIVAVGIFSVMPDKWFDRIETIKTYEEDGSALGRINAWWFAYNLTLDRPVAGGGFGAFDPELFREYAPTPDDYHDAHSIYFEVLGEHGYMGLLLFLSLGWLSLSQAEKIKRITYDKPDMKWAYSLMSMVQLSLVGYAVGGAFLGLAYFDLYYHLVALVVLTTVVVRKEVAELDVIEESVSSRLSV